MLLFPERTHRLKLLHEALGADYESALHHASSGNLENEETPEIIKVSVVLREQFLTIRGREAFNDTDYSLSTPDCHRSSAERRRKATLNGSGSGCHGLTVLSRSVQEFQMDC